MPRDSGGTYSSPSGPFVTGTTISSNVMNSKLSDLGSEITDSLSRSGEGGMLAELRLVAGTSSLPGLAFTAETTTGLYRAGAGDIRMANNGTDIAGFKATEFRMYQAGIGVKGLTLTQSTSNTTALAATGNGTAAGVTGVGGATGVGGSFTGGASGADGLTAAGTGTGGHGLTVSAGTSAGRGLNVTAGAYGAYLRAGIGINAIASAGVGAEITGAAGAVGAIITGGSGSVGVQAVAGTAATGADPTNALECTNGNLKLSGTAPNSDEALANTLTPINLPKAWAKITTTGGGSTTATVNAGFNVASAVASGTTLTLNIAQDLTTAGIALVTAESQAIIPQATCQTADVLITAWDIGGAAAYNWQAASAKTVYVLVFGAQ